MKRYAVFQGYYYYPAVGWKDHVQSFENEDEAREYVELESGGNDWWQIVDLTTGHIIDSGSYDD